MLSAARRLRLPQVAAALTHIHYLQTTQIEGVVKCVSGNLLCLAGAAFLASAPAQAAPAAPALPDADPAIWVVKDPGHDHLSVRHVPRARRQVGLVQRRGQDRLRQVRARSCSKLPPMEDQGSAPAGHHEICARHVGQAACPKSCRRRRARSTPRRLPGLGAPPTAFDKFRPFFAALTVVMAGAQKLGMTAENGAEAVLTQGREGEQEADQRARDRSTIRWRCSPTCPKRSRSRCSRKRSTSSTSSAPMFAEMNKHWTTGDAEGFAKLMNEMDAQSPAMYKIAADRPQRQLGGVDRQAARQARHRVRRRRRGPSRRQGQRPGLARQARHQERARRRAITRDRRRPWRAAVAAAAAFVVDPQREKFTSNQLFSLDISLTSR